MGSRKKQIVGYRYFAGLHMGLCMAMDKLKAARVGDKDLGISPVTTNGSQSISKGGLFGGDEGEGGIAGTLQVLFGGPTQPVSTPLAAMLGGLVPAFRGKVTVFFDGQFSANSRYPQPWTFRGVRRLAGWDGGAWYPEKAAIDIGAGATLIEAMNPAHLLYECFTNRSWGRGLPRSRMDDARWRAAADKLYDEGFGLCLKWSLPDSLKAFVQGVMDHIGAVQYVDPATGLVVLDLVRDDYDASALPLYDADSGLLSIEEDEAGSQPAAVNEVIVKYRDPLAKEDKSVRVKNPAAIASLGAVSSVTREYPGIPTAALALRVAQRDLKAAAGFLKKFKVRLDRRAYRQMPGSVFKIRDLKRNISSIVLRAGQVELGQLTDGAIVINAVQDMFGLPATSYVGLPVSAYVPPATTPLPLLGARLIELPYRDLAEQLDATALAQLTATSCFVAGVGGLPNVLTLAMQLQLRPGSAGPFEVAGEGQPAPAALLLAAMSANTTSVTLTGGVGLDRVSVGSPALVDDEVCRVDSLDAAAGTAVLARGCADTVPQPHAIGAVVLFYGDAGVSSATEYSSGVALQGKLLARTPSDLADPASSTTLSITTAQRQVRPYPPGDLKIGGQRFPATLADSTVALSWVHRSRVLQADQLVDTLQASVGPEAGTTYSVEIRNASTNALLAAATGITGTGYTSPPMSGSFQMRVSVWSVRGGLASAQVQSHQLAFTYALHATAAGALLNAGASFLQPQSPTSVTATLLQSAAAASAGSAYVSIGRVANVETGTTEPIPAGTTFTVGVQRDATAIGTFSYTTTSSTTRSTVVSGLADAAAAVSALAAAGISFGANSDGAGPFLQANGLQGVTGWLVQGSPTSPFRISVSVTSPGSPVVARDQYRVVRFAFAGAPARGDLLIVVLGGQVFQTVVRSTDSLSGALAYLAAAIDADAAYSVIQDGGTLYVSGVSTSDNFTYSASVRGAAAYADDAPGGIAPGCLLTLGASLIPGSASGT